MLYELLKELAGCVYLLCTYIINFIPALCLLFPTPFILVTRTPSILSFSLQTTYQIAPLPFLPQKLTNQTVSPTSNPPRSRQTVPQELGYITRILRIFEDPLYTQADWEKGKEVGVGEYWCFLLLFLIFGNSMRSWVYTSVEGSL